MENYERGSICGSIGGDTFASRGKKHRSILRQHSMASIAGRFEQQQRRELDRQQSVCSSIGGISIAAGGGDQLGGLKEDIYAKKRWNTSFHSYRFIVVMFGGFSIGLMLLLRYSITVAMLNMVNQTAIYLHEHPNNTIEDFYAEGYLPTGGEFDWDNEIQHMIMSWYMIAYTLPQIPSTTFGLMLGTRWAFPLSLSLCGLSTVLTPIVSYWGWQWTIGLRLFMGISAAMIMPMLLNLVESWMPYDQMTLGLTFAQLLQTVLSAANPLVAGYLCSIHWKYAFYVPGFATFLFCILWIIFITDEPEDNWFVSAKEIELINMPEKKDGNEKSNTLDTKIDVAEEPEEEANWRDIFKTPAIYAYMILWGFYCSPYSVFVFILPTYLRQFLKIPVAENGLYCFIIQTGCLLSVLWPHPLLKFFNEKLGLSWTASRRLAYLITCSLVGGSFLYIGMFHTNQLIALWINRAFIGSNDIIVTGNLMSNFAKAGLSSVAFSVMNTIGNLVVVFASTFTGYVLDQTAQSVEGWSYIFYGLAATQLFVLFIFSTCMVAGPINFKPKKEAKEDAMNKSKTNSPLGNLKKA